MATLEQKINAELMLRSMVDREGLPEPDHIEYGHACIRAIWWESKVALVVDIDDIGPGVESLEDLGLDPIDLGADAGSRLDEDADDWEATLDGLDHALDGPDHALDGPDDVLERSDDPLDGLDDERGRERPDEQRGRWNEAA